MGTTLTVSFETATSADVAAIVALLADDELGAEREGTDLAPYRVAFDEIDADPAHDLVVGRRDGRVVAVLQLSFLPCMTHGGARRAQLEGVRVAKDLRGAGVGEAMVRHAVALAWSRGCSVVQLTTDRRRDDARRFYERLGFRSTHHGMKLTR